MASTRFLASRMRYLDCNFRAYPSSSSCCFCCFSACTRLCASFPRQALTSILAAASCKLCSNCCLSLSDSAAVLLIPPSDEDELSAALDSKKRCFAPCFIHINEASWPMLVVVDAAMECLADSNVDSASVEAKTVAAPPATASMALLSNALACRSLALPRSFASRPPIAWPVSCDSCCCTSCSASRIFRRPTSSSIVCTAVLVSAASESRSEAGVHKLES
mmetsp:Transcript_18333/g.30725  ORF Transcript_18333/g.30725 Transcript_18333/m.30725 type:complete len:220 (-) Transcript_18333:156-815(-)